MKAEPTQWGSTQTELFLKTCVDKSRKGKDHYVQTCKLSINHKMII